MAVDEALLQSAAEQGVATLRFYGWAQPTLSLGYFQHHADRARHPASAACAVVRRRSGGGAIVHHHELTYSFAVPCSDRFRGDPRRYYVAFHQTLACVLAEQGVECRPHDGGARAETAFLCFQRRADGDLVLRGHKIAGSAQRRRRSGLIQHGSLLLRTSALAPELPGLAELTGLAADPHALSAAWAQRLADRLNVRLVVSGLAPAEWQAADRLQRERFGTLAWTHGRPRGLFPTLQNLEL